MKINYYVYMSVGIDKYGKIHFTIFFMAIICVTVCFFLFFLLLATWIDLQRFVYTRGFIGRIEKSYISKNEEEDIYVIYWIEEKKHTFNFRTTAGKYSPGDRVPVRYFRDLPEFGEFDNESKMQAVIQLLIPCGALALASIILALVSRKYKPRNHSSNASFTLLF